MLVNKVLPMLVNQSVTYVGELDHISGLWPEDSFTGQRPEI
jgi:hypothetical protein